MTLPIQVRRLTEKYIDAGCTVSDLAQLFAVKPGVIRSRLQIWELKAAPASKTIKKPRDYRPTPTSKYMTTERDMSMCKMYQDGLTLETIGQKFNISRERVRQILVKNNITDRDFRRKQVLSERKIISDKIMSRYLAGRMFNEIADDKDIPETFHLYRPRTTKIQRQVHRAARFWSLVEKQETNHPRLGTPCWFWTGNSNPVTGYGRFSLYSRKFEGAHRVAYELTKGVPKQWVLHWCDIPKCVNPDHLYDGTPKENARDRDLIHPKKPRLLEAQVEKIKLRLANNDPLDEIARDFDRCPSIIYGIGKGRFYDKARQSRITEEVIRRVWALKGTVSYAKAQAITGISTTNIGNIWLGRIGREITGSEYVPKKKQTP